MEPDTVQLVEEQPSDEGKVEQQNVELDEQMSNDNMKPVASELPDEFKGDTPAETESNYNNLIPAEGIDSMAETCNVD